MDKGLDRSNSFAVRTLIVLLVGMFPMVILSLFPDLFSGFSSNDIQGGVSSLNHPEMSVLFKNYVTYFAPLFGVLSFFVVRNCSGIKNNFESLGKFYLVLLQYTILVFVIYYLFYFSHLELTKSNMMFRRITNSLFGFKLFYIFIVFPSLVVSLQILLLSFKVAIKGKSGK